MSNPKFGNKHLCKECDTRFFDMKKSPAICPKCSHQIKEPKPAKSRRPVAEAAPVAAVTEGSGPEKAAVPAGAATEQDGDKIDDDLAELIPADDENGDEEALDNDEDDDELIEDTTDLGEDDDDLQEVREHIDDGSTDKG